MTGQSRIEQHLHRRRRTLRRLDPLAAQQAVMDGAVLVDIRPVDLRREHGEVPGALVIDRNVLEWRVDPTSPDRLPGFEDFDVRVVLFCQEGYASSLAAADLQELGLHRATDLDGGFAAWEAAGLPTRPWRG